MIHGSLSLTSQTYLYILPMATSECTTASLADTFRSLLAYYERQKLLTADNKLTFKIRATKNVIAALVATQPPTVVTSSTQFKGLPGFGKKTLDRVDVWLQKGTWPELEEPHSPMQSSGSAVPPTPPPMSLRRDNTLIALQTITGVGPAKAKKLFDAGATVQLLQDAVQKSDEAALLRYGVTHHQRLGIKYLEDTQHRVPRTVIRTFETFLNSWLTDGCIRTICGSYRRGKPDSGDIDVLVTHPSWTTDADAQAGLRSTIDCLKTAKWLVDDLTPGDKLQTKYMGFMRIPEHPWAVRLDVRAIPYARYVPALMYFTGSKDENIRLRRKALSLGYQLNEYGLTAIKSESAPLPTCHDEQAVYAALGEAYVEPTER